MDISIKELTELASTIVRESALFNGPAVETIKPETGFWEIGKPYFIRTVTHHYTGRCVAVNSQEVILETAAWIADDGRFAQAVAKGEFSEVEPYPADRRVLVGRCAILDAVEITTTPNSQK